nr:protein-methionine-sulfoxide reductase heme-binding subunit MsrQ [Microbulbifer elongatus]
MPLLWLYVAITDGRLGGDPVKELIHYLGMGAIRLLLLTLLVSPLAKAVHVGQLNRLRRPLGLWCFVWVTLHFAAWLVLDLGLDWSLIGAELVKRTYILLGFSAWLVLLMLAVTSIPALLKKMGRNWKKLHGLLYLVVILACWHFWWSVKSGWIEPAVYTAVALALLAWRHQAVARWARSFR